MRKLKFLVVHCTATPPSADLTGADIVNYHQNVLGWKKPGYADVVRRDGRIDNLQKFDTDDYIEQPEVTFGVAGENRHSRHIAYVGGINERGEAEDNRTEPQKRTLLAYIRYMVLRHPHIKVVGHRQLIKSRAYMKECPSFDVPTWLRSNNIDSKNIFT